MNNTQKNLIELFSYGVFGKEYALTDDFDFGDIFNLAKSLNVWLCVFPALKDMYEKGMIDIENDTFSAFNSAFLIGASNYLKRQKEVHKVIENLNKNEIETIVLKGETLSHLYKMPELRTSSDTDILIDEKDNEKALKIMTDMGLCVHSKSSVSHHTVCTSEKTGHIEVHTNIYEDYVDTLYFNNFEIKKDNLIKITASDGFELTSLDVENGLYFMTFHYIKHFLGSGASLKQISDLILYIKNNDIDFEKYISDMKKLGYDKLIKTTLGIGIVYFGIDANDLYNIDFDASDCVLLLEDIIESGVFGKSKEENRKINDEFLKFKLKENYKQYKKSFARRLFLKSASFNIKNLYSKYSYARKHKILVPIACVHHIFYIISASCKKVFAGRKTYNTSQIQKRLDLFEKLL